MVLSMKSGTGPLFAAVESPGINRSVTGPTLRYNSMEVKCLLLKNKKELDKVLNKGQEIKVRILHIDAERRRLGLGLVAFE